MSQWLRTKHPASPWPESPEGTVHFAVSISRERDDPIFYVSEMSPGTLTFMIRDRKACEAFLAKLKQTEISLRLELERFDKEQKAGSVDRTLTDGT